MNKKFTYEELQKLSIMTGAGLMECKKTLEETNGDYELAALIIFKKPRIMYI